jgi:transcriptional regulator with XRE-family HTH domain
MRTTPWRELEAKKLAAMSREERAEFDRAEVEAEARLQLAELVYNTRHTAGLTQVELARRVGTTQTAISAIENGERLPTVATLSRVAHALGRDLKVEMPMAESIMELEGLFQATRQVTLEDMEQSIAQGAIQPAAL